MAAPSVAPSARPWNPDFKHTDRERWICVYPAYINSRKSLKEGRRIPKDQAVDNPSYAEIRDVRSCWFDTWCRGQSLLVYLGQTIPKLKARTQSQSQSGGHQQQSSKQQKKKGRKGK